VKQIEGSMANQANFERTQYESRADAAAENISEFVEAVLGTIDAKRARATSVQWEIVCRFFAGSAFAARQQKNTPLDGGKRMAEYLTAAFPWAASAARDGVAHYTGSSGSRDGFDEFMDWLSNPATFRPSALRDAISSKPVR
jgi:hypothetical protein